MLQKPEKGKHEDLYVRRLCALTKMSPDTIRMILNAQTVELAMQLASNNEAVTTVGKVFLRNGCLVIKETSPHIKGILSGEVSCSDFTEEVSFNG